jgi:hypothetical protein
MNSQRLNELQYFGTVVIALLLIMIVSLMLSLNGVIK